MNTFMPYDDFTKSAQCLDSRRLRKQQVECKQMVEVLLGNGSGWRHHPAVLMWAGCENGLIAYAAEIASECARRGYSTNSYMATQAYYNCEKDMDNPWWVGTFDVHYAYRSKLMFKGRKDALEQRIRIYMRPPTITGCRSVGSWLRQGGFPQMNRMDHAQVAVLEALMDKRGVERVENHYAKYFGDVPDNLPYFWPRDLEREEQYAAP